MSEGFLKNLEPEEVGTLLRLQLTPAHFTGRSEEAFLEALSSSVHSKLEEMDKLPPFSKEGKDIAGDKVLLRAYLHLELLSETKNPESREKIAEILADIKDPAKFAELINEESKLLNNREQNFLEKLSGMLFEIIEDKKPLQRFFKAIKELITGIESQSFDNMHDLIGFLRDQPEDQKLILVVQSPDGEIRSVPTLPENFITMLQELVQLQIKERLNSTELKPEMIQQTTEQKPEQILQAEESNVKMASSSDAIKFPATPSSQSNSNQGRS